MLLAVVQKGKSGAPEGQKPPGLISSLSAALRTASKGIMEAAYLWPKKKCHKPHGHSIVLKPFNVQKIPIQ